jgi:large repetitive protein
VLLLGPGGPAVVAGVALTPAQAASIVFVPALNFNGTVNVPFTVTDNLGAVSAPAAATVNVTPVNDAPVATPSSATGAEDAASIPLPLAGSDADGTVTGVTVTALPPAAQGVLLLGPGGPAVVAGVALTPAQAASIVFVPALNFNGTVNVPFTVTDNAGAVSVPANSVVTVTPAPDLAAPVVTVRPVGYWTFDEGSGTGTTNAWAGQSGGLSTTGAAGTPPPSWVAGHVPTAGTALDFDGTGGLVTLPTAATGTLMATSTLSFWIRTTQAGTPPGTNWNSPAVIGSEQTGSENDIQWGVLDSSGRIGFSVGNDAGVFSATPVNDGTWHQVAIARDAATSEVVIYVDGVESGRGTSSFPVFDGTLNRLLGFGNNNRFSGADGSDEPDLRFLDATLDDVRIYDRVLSADQVAAIRAVESGFHDTAIANDGGALKFALGVSNTTALTVTGLNAGMTISDGVNSATALDPDTPVTLTGWNLAALQITGAGTGSATLAFEAVNSNGSETRTDTTYLNVVNGTSLQAGGAGADTLVGTGAADLMSGSDGSDSLSGLAGNDRLLGGAGADTLDGGAGRDVLIGGAGDDRLIGGTGADVFAWSLADRGLAGGPAVDTVADFSFAPTAAGGDTLDLRDLLIGSTGGAADLTRFLDFNVVGGSTEIRISSSGGFTGGDYQAGAEDQRIVLEGVNIRDALGLAGAATDAQILQELLNRGKLLTDAGA